MSTDLESFVCSFVEDIPFVSIEKENVDIQNDMKVCMKKNYSLNVRLEHIYQDYKDVKKKLFKYEAEKDKLRKQVNKNRDNRKLYKKSLKEYYDASDSFDKFKEKYLYQREKFYKTYYDKYKVCKKVNGLLVQKHKLYNSYYILWTEFISALQYRKNECRNIVDSRPPSARTRAKTRLFQKQCIKN
jgi:hypothetical protein